MKKHFVLILLGFISFSVLSQIPDGYYDDADGLSGDALKTALYNIIDDHTEFSYAAVKEALKNTDEDPDNSNNIICLYTGWSYAKTEFGNGSEQWNREHVWSKSHGDFGDVAPAGTDLHHLRPTDASVNSAKSSRDFDFGTIQYIDGSGATECYYSGTDIWAPWDQVRGDVARMIFYMATRYEGDGGEPDLEIVDYVNSAPSNEPYYGKLSTLLVWHNADPVDDWERNRNDVIYYSYQGNRNPFIDHPEYVAEIWGETGSTTSLIIAEVADPDNAANAKYVELYNLGTDPVNFNSETWYLSWQANGGSWANVQLTGTIGAGETFILSYNATEFFNSYGFNADMNSGVVSGNGDDGYYLYFGANNASGTLIDAYGVIDVDGTGEDWEYTNTKAVRAYHVASPNATWTASEWFISATADDSDMTPDWHRKSLDWNGTTSTDWHTVDNWTEGAGNSSFLPDASSKITISSNTNNTIVTGVASCGDVTVNGTGNLIISTGSNLTVGGN